MKRTLLSVSGALILAMLFMAVALLAGCEDKAEIVEQQSPRSGSVRSENPNVTVVLPTVNVGATSSSEPKSGRSVFQRACRTCHGPGRDGAPRVGDAAAWQGKLERELDNLIQHATRGFNHMPQKGGLQNLSDADVAAAVAYVVAKQRRASATIRTKGSTGQCHPINNPIDCSREEFRDAVSLYVLGLLGGIQARPQQRHKITQSQFR